MKKCIMLIYMAITIVVAGCATFDHSDNTVALGKSRNLQNIWEEISHSQRFSHKETNSFITNERTVSIEKWFYESGSHLTVVNVVDGKIVSVETIPMEIYREKSMKSRAVSY